MDKEDQLSQQESLAIIQQMINKAKNSYHENGTGAILWGCVIAFCSLATFASIQFNLKLPFDVWLLTIIAIVPQVFIAIKNKNISKAEGYDDRILDSVWLCFGISIFILTIIQANLTSGLAPLVNFYKQQTNNPSPFKYYEFNSAFFLMLYAIPTFITGRARSFNLMVYGAFVCWGSCIASIFTSIKIDMLLMALSAICAWLIPGIILRAKYLKLKKQHV